MKRLLISFALLLMQVAMLHAWAAEASFSLAERRDSDVRSATLEEKKERSARNAAMKVEDLVLLPRPQQLTLTGGTFKGKEKASTKVVLVDSLPGTYDYVLSGYPNEAYELTINRKHILIRAVTAIGVLRARQTLTQLRESADGALPCCHILDWPAFKLRGYMHDVGRSFISTDELKKEIDLLARFKVNTFHWHLTENQAWRLQIEAYPQLTADTSMTRFPGKYYTQAECREVEEYAARRGITVIPEIDMPGHSAAFERAMGHGMMTAEGKEELKVIIKEATTNAFPLAPYIHIGADETAVDVGFLQEMADLIHQQGKRVVTWNPIHASIHSSFADMTQMWSTRGKAVSGVPNIDCRYNYVNHFDVFADVVGIYKSNIYYAPKGNADLAGTITAVWNDRKMESEHDIICQNNFYANVLASAERAWCGGGEQYIEDGGTRLPGDGKEHDEFADWERRFLFHKHHALKDEPIPYVRQANVRWRVTDAFPNEGNANAGFPPEVELKEEYAFGGTACHTHLFTGAGIYLRHTWGSIVPSAYTGEERNATAYAWTFVYSPKEQDAGALIEFQNYGRSEKDLAPETGKWDRKGSRIWLNDEEIAAPEWENSGLRIDNETYLRNENLTARKPSPIHLHEGWNKVFMKLPFNPDGGLRLAKWMFTFVITDTEGCEALDDLIYDPDFVN